MLNLLLIICLTFLLYEVTTMVVRVPDLKVEKKINRLKRRSKEVKEKKENVLLIRFFVPLFRFMYQNIKGLRYNEYKIKSDLEKVGINNTPEAYMASGFLYSFIAIMTTIFLYTMTGAGILLILGVVLGFGMPFYPKSDLRGKVRKLNEQILKEFPNFVSTLRFQYGKGKTLNDIIQSYMEVAGPALRYELQKLSAELEMMSSNDALLRFGERIGLTEVSNFASALVYGQMYGMDINQIFAVQEQEMRRLTRDNIRKEMKRKPLYMTVAITLPILNILIILGVPPLINMVKSMSQLQ